ncbi:MAG: rhomboid family intramembrane serine protease [Pseudomonadota bacterium]
MLLAPLDRPFDWKHPPRLALGLCLLLLLIFIPWHSADRHLERELAEQYRKTLMDVEWPLYETHANRTGQRVMLGKLKGMHAASTGDPAKLDQVALYVAMDDGFVAALELQGRDYMSAEQFANWQRARAEFNPRRGSLSTQALGVDPQEFRPITFLTFGLVQADFVQLLAALLLLLTVGVAVELALGSGAVLAGLLGGGATGALAFLASNGSDVLPLSGASVGLAAVAGMYLMHFRTGKVLVANRLQWPAYSLAGLWVALVALESLLAPLRTCEVVARVAALASGPLWAHAYARWFVNAADFMPVISDDAPEDAQQLEYRQKLNQALEAVARLDFPVAQKVLREMVKQYPSDLRVLSQLYYLEKLTPGPTFDAVARRLFGMAAGEADTLVLGIYRDYLRYSPNRAALDVETSLKLVLRFTRMREVMEADKLMRLVLEKNTSHPLIAKAAALLADAMERLQEPVRARFFRQVAAG